MSADEDTELKDLVTQSLENNGVLGKIRAQLRASVFLALEEQSAKEQIKTPLVNKELKDFLTTKNGKLTANLIKEFFEYFELENSQAVFDPETSLNVCYDYHGRRSLCDEFSIKDDTNEIGPVLSELITKCLNIPKRKDEKNISEAAQRKIVETKFEIHDKRKKGALDKEGVCDLFLDIFPNFRRNMLEPFIIDEFQSLNRHYNQGISIEEFLIMRDRFVLMCCNVVNDADQVKNVLRLENGADMESVDKNETIDDSTVEKYLPMVSFKINDGLISSKDSPKSAEDHSEAEDSFFDDNLPRDLHNPLIFNQDLKQDGSDFGSSIFGDDSPKSIDDKVQKKPLDIDPFSLVTTREEKSLGFLKDAPPLITKKIDNRTPIWKDLEVMDQRIAGLGLSNPQEDDYEEDFQSSLSARSDLKSGTENSIEEEIEVDISGTVDDLLNSSNSGGDDVTTDKTVSQISGTGIDYLESVG